MNFLYYNLEAFKWEVDTITTYDGMGYVEHMLLPYVVWVWLSSSWLSSEYFWPSWQGFYSYFLKKRLKEMST